VSRDPKARRLGVFLARVEGEPAMADDLKTMLKKVHASKGEKKFHFAYGTGKRKDGKGEGELAVRGKKLKKAEIEAQLTDCKDVFQGVCWTGAETANGETVYFLALNKKLSTTVLTKMKLTAKVTIGRQCDFEIASPEEEARAASLAEATESEEGEQEGENDADSTGNPASPDAERAAEFQRIKDALYPAATHAAGASPEHKDELTRLLDLAGQAEKAMNYDAGLAILAELKVAIEKAGQSAQSHAKSTEKAQDGSDLAAIWQSSLNMWTKSIKQAMLAKGPNTAAVARLLSQAMALSKPGGDMAQAIAKLTECNALATSGAAVVDPPNAELLVEFRKAADDWKRTRLAANAGLVELQKTLLLTKDPRAVEIAKTLQDQLKPPAQAVDAALDVLRLAIGAGESPSGPAGVGLKRAMDACAAALADKLVEKIEHSPFPAKVELRKPLLASLSHVRTLLRA
jgi:hypothetical protein